MGAGPGKGRQTAFCPGCDWQSLEQPGSGGCRGINWKTHEILLGECKWGTDRVDRQIVRELIETKTPLVLKDLPSEGVGWQVHTMLFARSGFTPAAIEQLQKVGGLAVDLNDMDAILGHESSYKNKPGTQ